jgi:DnaJ-domain-containing protein 1
MLRESGPMPDHFAALDQPRRPWLDAETLKQCFHRASAVFHPDVPGSGDAVRFAAVNAAYRVLLDPVGRIVHLLELQAPEQLTRPQTISPDLADLFMRLAEFRQAFSAFQKRESAATQELARALLMADRQKLWQHANALHAELESAHNTALALLQALDAEWESGAADVPERLAALHQRFAYLSKWRAQLGESMFQLQQ